MQGMYRGNPPTPGPPPLSPTEARGGSPTGGQWLASSEDGGARSWRLLVMMWQGGQRGLLMNTRPPGPIPRPRTRGPHAVHDLAPDVSPGCRSGSPQHPGLCPDSPPPSCPRKGGQVGGRAGWGHMVGRKAEKSQARGEGCVHGAQAVTGSEWPGCFCLSWG